MTIPATVVVGVGGQGSTVALRFRQRLLDYADERAQAQREREYIEKYVRVFAVDTKTEDEVHNLFPANERWILQPGGIPQIVQGVFQPPQPGAPPNFLREWWPRHILNPGDFLQGAGAMRAKGRLAYYLLGQGIGSTIAQTVTNLRDVRNADPGVVGDAQPVYVILVGSVSGGTGSGILLTLAMHLRSQVTGNVKIIGAIPTASVMEMAPSKLLEQNVWANCSAALREIEWFLTPPHLRISQISPFFKVSGDTITGDGTDNTSGLPFDLCYLFTRSNRNGKVFGQHADYTQLIADCLALDISSPVSDQSQAMLSNFIQRAVIGVRPQPPTKACKPVVFAAAGAASLEYPVRNIAGYLGDQLVKRVLDEYFLSPADLGDEAATWASTHRLEERGLQANPMHEDLKKPFRDPDTRQEIRIGAAPGIPGLESANRRTVRTVITEARTQFDRRWVPSLQALVAKNYQPLRDARRAEIWERIRDELGSTDGEGFERALRFATLLQSVLEINLEDVDREINGPDNGRLVVLDRLEKGLLDKAKSAPVKGEFQQLEDAFSGFFVLPARTKEAKDRFFNRWWKPYIDHRENVVVGQAVIELYRDILNWLRSLIDILQEIETELKGYRLRLERESATRLGRRGMLVLEERVLDHRTLVDEAFRDRLAEESKPGSQTCKRLAGALLQGAGGIRTLVATLNDTGPATLELRRARIRDDMQALMERLRREGAGVFWLDVSKLTLWDALAREAQLRTSLPPELNMEDDYLRAIARSSAQPSSAEELIERYIVARVQQCVETAAPFWQLDTNVELTFKQTFPVDRDGLISYSAAPFADTNNRRNASLARALEGIADRHGFSTHRGNESPYRLIVSTREIGAPLFMLSSRERDDLLNNERRWAQVNGHVYMDERFVNVLPRDMDLASTTKLASDHREARALVMAMYFGYMQYGKGRDGRTNRGVVQITSNRDEPRWKKFSNGIAEALNLLKANGKRVSELEEAVGYAWRGVAEQQRASELRRALRWVQDELEEVPSQNLPNPRRETLELMLEAVEESLHNGVA